MPPLESTIPAMLRCTQCAEMIASPEVGLYALLPPPPPHAGYRELCATHRRCAADYEAAHGVAIPWLPLERIWPRAAADAGV